MTQCHHYIKSCLGVPVKGSSKRLWATVHHVSIISDLRGHFDLHMPFQSRDAIGCSWDGELSPILSFETRVRFKK